MTETAIGARFTEILSKWGDPALSKTTVRLVMHQVRAEAIEEAAKEVYFKNEMNWPRLDEIRTRIRSLAQAPAPHSQRPYPPFEEGNLPELECAECHETYFDPFKYRLCPSCRLSKPRDWREVPCPSGLVASLANLCGMNGVANIIREQAEAAIERVAKAKVR